MLQAQCAPCSGTGVLVFKGETRFGRPYPAGPQAHVPFLIQVAAYRAHTSASWKLPHVGTQSISLFLVPDQHSFTGLHLV